MYVNSFTYRNGSTRRMILANSQRSSSWISHTKRDSTCIDCPRRANTSLLCALLSACTSISSATVGRALLHGSLWTQGLASVCQPGVGTDTVYNIWCQGENSNIASIIRIFAQDGALFFKLAECTILGTYLLYVVYMAFRMCSFLKPAFLTVDLLLCG